MTALATSLQTYFATFAHDQRVGRRAGSRGRCNTGLLEGA